MKKAALVVITAVMILISVRVYDSSKNAADANHFTLTHILGVRG